MRFSIARLESANLEFASFRQRSYISKVESSKAGPLKNVGWTDSPFGSISTCIVGLSGYPNVKKKFFDPKHKNYGTVSNIRIKFEIFPNLPDTTAVASPVPILFTALH
uniref:Uncharacterized protein n=1 Tax=Romanomermis culicivorax TaxID=13658 RepID=A0A915K8C7_ROMCU